MDKVDIMSARLECLRIAVENGRQRDIMDPHEIAEVYWQWVSQGSEDIRPVGSREDDSPTRAKKSRSVRKGSTPQFDNAN